MKFYEERLVTLTLWSHKISRLEQLAATDFQYSGHLLCSDEVKCIAYEQETTKWESDDNLFAEHIRLLSSYSFIRSIQVDEAQEAAEKEAQKVAQKEAQKPTFISRDLAFFDPSLQYNFSKLRLYHDINNFVEHILHCADRYREIDVTELLSKCLRDHAFTWSQSIQLKDVTLVKYMEVLTAKFEKPLPASQEPFKSTV